MKRFSTLITALALFCVQPNMPNVDFNPTTTIQSAGQVPDHPCDEAGCPNSGQMPEIEVEQFGGEFLHVTQFACFELPLIGKLFSLPPMLPHEHTSIPLLRPPRA